jgi:hypothetical protein
MPPMVKERLPRTAPIPIAAGAPHRGAVHPVSVATLCRPSRPIQHANELTIVSIHHR